MGRPTKFKEEHMVKIKKMALAGFTDKEMSDLLSVTEQTFNNWKKKHPEFFESLKEWKNIADEQIEKSLYKSAMGFEIVTVTEKEIDGNVVPLKKEQYFAPNPTSIIFWLKNRKPKEWRDKQELEHSGEIKLPDIKIVSK